MWHSKATLAPIKQIKNTTCVYNVCKHLECPKCLELGLGSFIYCKKPLHRLTVELYRGFGRGLLFIKNKKKYLVALKKKLWFLKPVIKSVKLLALTLLGLLFIYERDGLECNYSPLNCILCSFSYVSAPQQFYWFMVILKAPEK